MPVTLAAPRDAGTDFSITLADSPFPNPASTSLPSKQNGVRVLVDNIPASPFRAPSASYNKL